MFTTKVFVLSTLFFYVYSWCNEIERKTVFLISGSRNYYLGLRMQLWNCKRGGLKLWSYFLLHLAHFWSFLQLMVSLLQSTNDTVKLKKKTTFLSPSTRTRASISTFVRPQIDPNRFLFQTTNCIKSCHFQIQLEIHRISWHWNYKAASDWNSDQKTNSCIFRQEFWSKFLKNCKVTW